MFRHRTGVVRQAVSMTCSLTAKVLLLILLGSSSAAALAEPMTHVGERSIARGEVTAFIREQFALADVDRDGTISQGELKSFRSRLDRGDQALFDRIAVDAFEQADIDADGKIALWEADQKAMQLFDLVDLDGDSVASREEEKTAVAITDLDTRDVADLLDRLGAAGGW